MLRPNKYNWVRFSVLNEFCTLSALEIQVKINQTCLFLFFNHSNPWAVFSNNKFMLPETNKEINYFSRRDGFELPNRRQKTHINWNSHEFFILTLALSVRICVHITFFSESSSIVLVELLMESNHIQIGECIR